jgi:hypothetical protein
MAEAQPTEEQLLHPDVHDALANAGMILHFCASQPDVPERFARYMEHGGGDLDPEFVARWMKATHDVLSPGCPMDWPGPPDRAAGLPPAHD